MHLYCLFPLLFFYIPVKHIHTISFIIVFIYFILFYSVSSFIDSGTTEFSESFDKTLNHFETSGQKQKAPSAKHYTPKEKQSSQKLEPIIEDSSEKKQEAEIAEISTANAEDKTVSDDIEKSDTESAASPTSSPEPNTAAEEVQKTAEEIQFEKLQKASMSFLDFFPC